MDDGHEIQQLRSTVRDLIAVGAVPATWIGREPLLVAEDLVGLLLSALRADLVFVRFQSPSDERVLERAGSSQPIQAADVSGSLSAAVDRWLAHAEPTAVLSGPEFQGLVLHPVVRTIGLEGEYGTLVVASHRQAFPSELEKALLNMAATQVAVWWQGTKLLHERKLAELELREQTRQAHQAIQVRDDFFSIAAHELRTPITSLRGSSQLLLRNWDRPDRLNQEGTRSLLEIIDQQATRLAQLVTQLLDVTNIERGSLTLDPQPTALADLVEQSVAVAQARSDQHPFHVHIPAAVEALIDPLRMEQVLTNLLDNAIKYSPSGGPIVVELRQPTSTLVQLSVTDRGLGVPPADRELIFERAYQAHQDVHISGLGLGLYICRQVVHQHGGRIWMEAPSEGGSRFVVELPVGIERSVQGNTNLTGTGGSLTDEHS
jgi:signal transduction histidine kinase